MKRIGFHEPYILAHSDLVFQGNTSGRCVRYDTTPVLALLSASVAGKHAKAIPPIALRPWNAALGTATA